MFFWVFPYVLIIILILHIHILVVFDSVLDEYSSKFVKHKSKLSKNDNPLTFSDHITTNRIFFSLYLFSPYYKAHMSIPYTIYIPEIIEYTDISIATVVDRRRKALEMYFFPICWLIDSVRIV